MDSSCGWRTALLQLYHIWQTVAPDAAQHNRRTSGGGATAVQQADVLRSLLVASTYTRRESDKVGCARRGEQVKRVLGGCSQAITSCCVACWLCGLHPRLDVSLQTAVLHNQISVCHAVENAPASRLTSP